MTTDGLDELTHTDATLVVGDRLHDDVCERLAEGEAVKYPIRVVGPNGPCADTNDSYDAGVYNNLDLTEAGVAVTDALANLAPPEDNLEPGAVHVCVDGLPQPTSEKQGRDLFRFLHAIVSSVRNRDGGCHVHLPASVNDDLPTTVAPIFDQIIGPQETEGGPTHRIQRWDKPDPTAH